MGAFGGRTDRDLRGGRERGARWRLGSAGVGWWPRAHHGRSVRRNLPTDVGPRVGRRQAGVEPGGGGWRGGAGGDGWGGDGAAGQGRAADVAADVGGGRGFFAGGGPGPGLRG